jgi:hypothetical protein
VSNTWWARIRFDHTCYYSVDLCLNPFYFVIITVLLDLLDQTKHLPVVIKARRAAGHGHAVHPCTPSCHLPSLVLSLSLTLSQSISRPPCTSLGHALARERPALASPVRAQSVQDMPACALTAHWTRQRGSTRRRIRPSLPLRLCARHLPANGYTVDMLERLRKPCRRRPRIKVSPDP